MGPQKKYDVIVVGSGIAGLSVALRLADKGHTVGIITKKDSAESNTNYAQGGIAAVTSNSDEIDIHVEDTLKAGDGLCDRLVVEEILRVLLSTTLSVTGIKPSATTVDRSNDSKIDFLSTSIEKRFSLGNNILYSGNVPSSFLTDV